jgi:hypothetical protein
MEDLGTKINDWIGFCRFMLDETPGEIFLDWVIPELRVSLPIEHPDYPSNSASLGLAEFRDEMENRLDLSSYDLAIRFAALYPLRDAALLNPLEHRRAQTEGNREAFCYLAGLFAPEKITSLQAARFELQNMYWAGDWDRVEAIFRQIALLSLLPRAEFHALRAQYWFLSVFGRWIEYQAYDAEHESLGGWAWVWHAEPNGRFFEEYSHPRLSENDLVRGDSQDLARAQLSRPYVAERPSLAYRILKLWCSNPRGPWITPQEPMPEFESDELVVNDPTLDKTDEDRRTSMRRLQHETYRDFAPVGPVLLSDRSKERLVRALCGHAGGR